VTSDDLIGLIKTQPFHTDFTEMSSCLASLMQERPIVQLIAKHLWKRGVRFASRTNTKT
jgi:hypothetical protein